MSRLLLRLAAIALIAPLVTACGGGGGSRVVPSVPSDNSTSPQSAGSIATAPVPPATGVRTIVHLPLRNSVELEALVAQQGDKNSPEYRRFITPQQFAARYAPTTADLQSAAATLKSMGFTTHVGTQSVIADAPQSTVERAFNVHLRTTMSHGRSGMAADRSVTLPQSLARLNPTVAIAPPSTVHKDSVRAAISADGLAPDDRYGAYSEYWNTDLRQAYSLPATTSANGTGRTIAIVMATRASQADLQSYFNHENYTAISGLPVPTLQFVDVDGGAPFDPTGGSDEVNLDTQMSLGTAPGANEIVYDTPDLSYQSIYDAYTQVVNDNKADIVSSSFGGGELYQTAAYNGGVDYSSTFTQLFHDVFLQGNAQGQTFVASSGDMGANGCFDPTFTSFTKCVDWPASDPNVTSVGGTNLKTTTLPKPSTPGYPYSYALTSKYLAENANYDPLVQDIFYTGGPAFPNEVWGSGGGVSVFFKKPGYQYLVPNTIASGRNVPDVAMHMGGCPGQSPAFNPPPCNPDRSFDVIYLGGHRYGVIGTSASAPEFAGLLAVTEQRFGTRMGNANWYVYGLAAVSGDAVYHHRNIQGNNDGYATSSRYDQVIGVGTPYGAIFAGLNFPVAGDPQTITNP